jgi:hypothetical protein
MTAPDIKPEWRTATVVALCLSMRETQDWSALPILADALQDAGCDNDPLLALMRGGSFGYAEGAALVASVMSEETAAAVTWLRDMSKNYDCPAFHVLVAAATGNHHENADPKEDPPEYPGYYCSENDGKYLHFGGTDAHGPIPPEFWDHVQRATGKPIPGRLRAASFSCSC